MNNPFKTPLRYGEPFVLKVGDKKRYRYIYDRDNCLLDSVKSWCPEDQAMCIVDAVNYFARNEAKLLCGVTGCKHAYGHLAVHIDAAELAALRSEAGVLRMALGRLADKFEELAASEEQERPSAGWEVAAQVWREARSFVIRAALAQPTSQKVGRAKEEGAE